MPAWHVLLGPLPDDAAPVRRPLGPWPAQPHDAVAPIAGWSEIILELSAGAAGLRALQAVLDPDQRLLAASDVVHYRIVAAEGGLVLHRQASIGGRFEEDGTFRGTCWEGLAEGPDGATDLAWDLKPTDATAAQGEALRALVRSMEVRVKPTEADPGSGGGAR